MNVNRQPKLLRPRWLFGHLLALGLIVLFVALGLWQLRRLDQRQAHNAIVIERGAREPTALREALAEGEATGEVLEYLRVVAEGEFAPAYEVLLRGRSLGGQPGFNVLTPLVLDDDTAGEANAGSSELVAGIEAEAASAARPAAILVERGWVPYDNDTVPVVQAPPPEGPVSVSGLLRAPSTRPEGAGGRLTPRDPPAGELVQTFYVDVERLSAQMPFELVGAYLQQTASNPAQPSELPLPIPEPEVDEGPHRGYAIQWFSFAVIGVVGYAILLLRVRREE